jgi:uncharacterized membrane protein YedE/YeeE
MVNTRKLTPDEIEDVVQSLPVFQAAITKIANKMREEVQKKFRSQLKDIDGNPLIIQDKEKGNARYWIGGTLFGLGWAMVGACPGPIFILLGLGFLSVGLILIGAIFGTFLYGVFKDKLPH